MAREITAATRALPRVEEKQAEIVSLKRLVARRFMRHRLAVFGLGVITFMISFAYIGPFITPYSPDQVNLRERFAKPSIVMVQGSAGQPHLYGVEAIQARPIATHLDYDLPARFVRTRLDALRVPFVDLTPLFARQPADKVFFGHDLHFTPFGHRLVAGAVRPLIERVAGPRASP